jgi:DNA-binding response OmpR family regulator
VTVYYNHIDDNDHNLTKYDSIPHRKVANKDTKSLLYNSKKEWNMKKTKIIVVEEKSTQDCASAILKHSGFDCRIFTDCQNATDSLTLDPTYELALVDACMTCLSVSDLFSEMNRHGIPTLCLVSDNDIISEAVALDNGAEDCIRKPINARVLLARIMKILKRSSNQQSILVAGDIVVDLDNHTVSKNDELICLTPIEFSILSMLIENSNKTVTREKMLNEIWGNNYFGDTHTVDVHISSIRKKMKIGDRIKTVYKRGYRLEDESVHN